MHCSEIIDAENLQIIPASYNNHAKRIRIPDLPAEIIPGSPEGPKAAAPPSGFATPVPGLGSGMMSPRDKTGTPNGGNTPTGVKTPPNTESEHDISIRIHDVVQHDHIVTVDTASTCRLRYR